MPTTMPHADPGHDDPGTLDQLAYRPAQAAKVSGVSRARVYEAVASGELPARKMGTATLILRDDLRTWLTSLPLREI